MQSDVNNPVSSIHAGLRHIPNVRMVCGGIDRFNRREFRLFRCCFNIGIGVKKRMQRGVCGVLDIEDYFRLLPGYFALSGLF